MNFIIMDSYGLRNMKPMVNCASALNNIVSKLVLGLGLK